MDGAVDDSTLNIVVVIIIIIDAVNAGDKYRQVL